MRNRFLHYSKEEIKDRTIVDLFDQKADAWSKKYSSILASRLQAFESILKSIKGEHKTLLDVGCATGEMLKMAHKLGFEVYGIDISPQMIDLCKKNLGSSIPIDKIICGNLEDNIFEHSKFDVIICSSLYEYLKTPELYLELFHKLLNINGLVLITIPDTKSIIRICEAFLKKIIDGLPFLAQIHPKFNKYCTYIKISKNRPDENQFHKITSKKNFIIKKKIYIGTSQYFESNNFFKSNLILYLLGKN